MDRLLQELGRLSLRLMELNEISNNVYAEKKQVEKQMAQIKGQMVELAGSTGEAIKRGEE
ncbi:MAG: hypothetical protein IJE10_11390 [Clostridia bacterium]|nr:hypothetical protein [Clostridia bacterium]